MGEISQGRLAGNISRTTKSRLSAFKIKFTTSLPFGMNYWKAAKLPIGRVIHHQRKIY